MHTVRQSAVPLQIQLQQMLFSLLDCCKIVLQFAIASVNSSDQAMYYPVRLAYFDMEDITLALLHSLLLLCISQDAQPHIDVYALMWLQDKLCWRNGVSV